MLRGLVSSALFPGDFLLMVNSLRFISEGGQSEAGGGTGRRNLVLGIST